MRFKTTEIVNGFRNLQKIILSQTKEIENVIEEIRYLLVDNGIENYKNKLYGHNYNVKVVSDGVIIDIIEEIEDYEIQSKIMKLLRQSGFIGNNYISVINKFIKYCEGINNLDENLENTFNDFEYDMKGL